MSNSANKKILDRSVSTEIQKNNGPFLELMKEIVDYGTNLILRCYGASPKTDYDGVIIGHFLRRAVMLLDTMEILLSKGSILSSEPIARALFENMVFTKWVFKEKTISRARHLVVASLRRQKNWTERVIPGTVQYNEHTSMINTIGKDKIRNDFPENEAKKRVKEIDEVLFHDEYREINASFDKAKKKSWDPEWYKIENGNNSIRNISITQLGLESEYNIFYATLSQSVHGTDIIKSITYNDGNIVIKPIRMNDTSAISLMQSTISYTFDVYELLINRYRPLEKENIARKYRLEWQERFNALSNTNN